jgi:hypothetical protein
MNLLKNAFTNNVISRTQFITLLEMVSELTYAIKVNV